ncbi:MAG: hypothetical protein AAF612_05245 [Planctomycetota bacterium]
MIVFARILAVCQLVAGGVSVAIVFFGLPSEANSAALDRLYTAIGFAAALWTAAAILWLLADIAATTRRPRQTPPSIPAEPPQAP